MRDIKGLTKFMDKYDIGTGFVITEDYEAEERYEDRVIKFIPLWKWLIGIKR